MSSMGLFKKLNPLFTMIIKDDFLPKDTLGKLLAYMLSPKVKWRYNEFKVRSKEDTDSFQFTQMVFEPTRFPISKERSMKALDPLYAQLDFDILIRVKVNMTSRTLEHNYTLFHTDTRQNNTTAIYYVNTNNGFTRFKDGTKVESKANRVVIFDAQTEHSGVTCTDEKVRVVVNLNYFPKILT